MPSIKLTKDESRIHECQLCGGSAKFYLVRKIAPSMFLCGLCVRPKS